MYLRSFKYEWLLFFPWLCYSSSDDESCLPLFMIWSLFGHDFLSLLGLKLYFHSPSEFGQVLFLTLELIVKVKTRELILYLNLLKVFIFQHGLNLKLSFLKSKAQVM